MTADYSEAPESGPETSDAETEEARELDEALTWARELFSNGIQNDESV